MVRSTTTIATTTTEFARSGRPSERVGFGPKSVRFLQKSLLPLYYPLLSLCYMTDFEKVVDFHNLYKAYKSAKSGKGYRYSSAKFESMALYGIHQLKELLETKQYKVLKYNEFYVYEPKQRLIKAAAFRDKIVQHSLCDNVLLPRLKNEFIRNNFAGQKGKGTLFGLNTLKNHMQSFYNEYGMDGYILKADITKFFYTIDHDILKDILRQYFSDEDFLWLCYEIIDSTPNPGLPLGNQTSQVFALLYLNHMDYYITKELQINFYGRYMDDFYLIHQSKEYLRFCLAQIEQIVGNLHLSLNNKTQIMPFKQGIKFIGFHTYIKDGKLVCKLNNKNKRNACSKYIRMAKMVVEGKMSQDKFNSKYTAWKSHAAFGDCEYLVENLDQQINSILRKQND